ncbi:MAG: PKD domain-containing protein [Solirubrobacteraceae bacterium]
MKARRSLLACAAASVLLGAGAGPAAADSPVLVTATVFPGGLIDTVTQSQLVANPTLCPTYAGPAIDEQPGGPAPVGQDTWPLSSILQCMETAIDPASVKSLTVVGENSPNSQLTAADLTGAASSGFPAGQLPVLDDGGSSWTYRRPPRNPADINGRDTATYQPGSPMLIEVYKGPQLTVNATATPGAASGAYTFSASATGDTGSGTLTYSWDFGNGDTSALAAPSEQFAPGTYSVAVQVADHVTGQSGSGTVTVTVDPAPAGAGPSPQSGGGVSSTATSPTGTKTPSPTPTASGAGAHMHHSSQSHPHAANKRSGKPAATTHTTTPAAATPAPATSAATTTAPAAPTSTAAPAATPLPRRTRPGQHSKPPGSTGRFVDGRLLTGLNAVPESASPLVYRLTQPVQSATAPQVRRATRTSALPGVAAGLVILLLFGLGAGRELRGQRALRSLRGAAA